MRVYDFWDYAVIVVDVIHFTLLCSLFVGMIYLFARELVKFKN